MIEKKDQSSQLGQWRGEFGEEYIQRNHANDGVLAALTQTWARLLNPMRPAPRNILEVGCNIGLNLRALRRLTTANLAAVEPNATARACVINDGVLEANDMLDGCGQNLPLPDSSVDLVFTSGVLIHVDPNDLAEVCHEIHRVSRQFVLCSEYFSTTPRMVNYRGQDGLLFTRDFGAFYAQLIPSLRLVDYGFFWTGAGAVDDLTWWLFEKTD